MRLVDWKHNEGSLTTGMVVKLPSGDICYVDSVSKSSAHIKYVSGYDKPITTRKGVTKIVTAHRPDGHISVNACVQYLDPDSDYAKRVRERMTMSEAVETTAEPTEKKTRSARIYTRTEKQPEKELRGQGAIVLAAITEMGSGSIPQVAEACKGQFNTRQSDERVVGFYLSKFKREGYVTTSDLGTDEPESTEEQVEDQVPE